jgi:hypothetical protein
MVMFGHRRRDAALPERPVFGVAALGNSVLGVAKRDDHLGGPRNGLERRLPDLTTSKRRELAAHLHRVLRDGVDSTYAADLGVAADPLGDPVRTSHGWRRPSGAALPTGAPGWTPQTRSGMPSTR